VRGLTSVESTQFLREFCGFGTTVGGSVVQTVVGDVTALAWRNNDRNNVETRPPVDAIYVPGSLRRINVARVLDRHE